MCIAIKIVLLLVLIVLYDNITVFMSLLNDNAYNKYIDNVILIIDNAFPFIRDFLD